MRRGVFRICGQSGVAPVGCCGRLLRLVRLRVLQNLLADIRPALLKRAHEYRLNEQEDVVFAGVVRSDERAAGGVERTLEEGSEDGGGDVSPVVVL